MAKRDRIGTLQRLASHTEAENARRLAERLRTLDLEERRLQQIRTYLAEYTGAAPGTTTGTTTGTTAGAGADTGAMTISHLRSTRGFVERLRNAVDAQRGTVERQRQLVNQQTAQWRAARSRTRSLELLGERRDEVERERQARRDQAAMDELATTRNGHSGRS